MDFYQSIFKYYDSIFPLKPQQVKFVQKELDEGATILDIGCATGSLAIALAEKGYEVKAFDLDDKMIDLAQQKKVGDNPEFKVGDMTLLAQNYAQTFDGVICFGNTIVHLTNAQLIQYFLRSISSKLKRGGKLLLQLLNYEYILSEQLAELPLIENDRVKFERFYQFRTDKLIDFRTKLTSKEDRLVVSNSIDLYPLTREQLMKMLKEEGFERIQFFGNFQKEALKTDSIPLVVVAEKQ